MPVQTKALNAQVRHDAPRAPSTKKQKKNLGANEGVKEKGEDLGGDGAEDSQRYRSENDEA